jgi:hypothetical protein
MVRLGIALAKLASAAPLMHHVLTAANASHPMHHVGKSSIHLPKKGFAGIAVFDTVLRRSREQSAAEIG